VREAEVHVARRPYRMPDGKQDDHPEKVVEIT
jgi:hypothetical protein